MPKRTKPFFHRGIQTLGWALLISTAAADVVHLTNGNWFEGVVIHENDQRIVVSTASGEIPLLRNQIERVVPGTEDQNLELLVSAALKTGNAVRALEHLAESLARRPSETPGRLLVASDRAFLAAIRQMPKDLSPEVRILLTRIGSADSMTPAGRVQLARLMAELEAPLEASDLLMSAGVGYLRENRDAGSWSRSFLNRTIRRLVYENRSSEAVEQLERLRLIDEELAELSTEPMMALAKAARARNREEYDVALRVLDLELAREYPALAANRTALVVRRLLEWAERDNREDDASEWVEQYVAERMPLEAFTAQQALRASLARTLMRRNDPAGALAVIEEIPESQRNEELSLLWKQARFDVDRLALDETNPAGMFKLALWAADQDLIDEAINLLERIRLNPILKDAADQQIAQLKHDRDVDILQRAVEAFDEGLMERVVDISAEMELNPDRESPVQKQAQDLAALARRSILTEQEKRPYIAEAYYQQAERAFMMERLDEAWKVLDTILTQYADTPAAGRAVSLLPEVARGLELELLEGRRFTLPDGARVETVLSARAEDILGEEIRRMVDMPLPVD